MSTQTSSILQWENKDEKYFNKFIHDLSCNINTSVKTLLDKHIYDQIKNREKMKNSIKAHKDIKKECIDDNEDNVLRVEDDSKISIDFSQNKKGKKGKNGKKMKNNGMKKKDLIIAKQKKLNYRNLVKDDLLKIDNFNYDINNIYNNIGYLKTNEGILHYKFTIFHTLYNNTKKINPTIIGLYYQLVNQNTLNLEFKKSLDAITNKLNRGGYDMTQYMLTNLGHILPPLNFWDHRSKSLDDWQIQVLRNAKHNQSTIVLAPTSSGKTFTAIGVCLLQKKVLYVVPTKPVAYQVASHFYNMKIRYNLVVDSNFPKNTQNYQILIGTPEYLEQYLPVIGSKFDYAVFDEIHNINKEDDGHMYENIIKLLKCNFLALSASIGNIEYIRDTWERINPDKKINLIKYNKRFINLQRHIWDGKKIVELHPLAAIDTLDLEKDFVNKYNLPFTPFDIYKLYDKMEEHFEDLYNESDSDEENMVQEPGQEPEQEPETKIFNVYEWKPCKYFEKYNIGDKLITLDQSREYENFLKDKLMQLYEIFPDRVSKMLESFKIIKEDNININRKLSKKCIYKIFRELFDNNMGPAIVFNVNTETCYKMFSDLYDEIYRMEELEYPYHYSILNYKQKLYLSYKERYSSFNEKLKEEERYDKLQNFDDKELKTYTTNISNYYEKLLSKIKSNDNIDENIRKIQFKNLYDELQEFLNFPDLSRKDVFKKHKKFCFTRQEPMSGDTIREIRREIKKSTGIEIEYESILFQMLKRGIGIYTENVPDIYKWIVQKLVSEKKLYFVISDRTLCLGIDLPFRSSVLMGYLESNDFTINDFTQMSGRAGRRGKDDKGNIIFCGPIKPLNLMKGRHLDITGNNVEVTDIMSLLNIISIRKNNINVDKHSYPIKHINDIYSINFNAEKDKTNEEIKEYINNCHNLSVYKDNLLEIVWNLRHENYELLEHFIKNINMLEKKLYMKEERDRERYLYMYLCEIFTKKSNYRIKLDNNKDLDEFIKLNENNELIKILYNIIIENRILINPDSKYTNREITKHIKHIGNASIIIYNALNKDNKYLTLCKTSTKLLKDIKHIIFNNIKFINNQ